MLKRCVTKGRCCPKLRGEDIAHDAAANVGNLYSNPHIQEELSQHLALHMSILDGDADFPEGATALMYEPPKDDMGHWRGDSFDDWTVEDVDSHQGASQMSNSLPAQLRQSGPRAASSGPGRPLHPSSAGNASGCRSLSADPRAGQSPRAEDVIGSQVKYSGRLGAREPTAATPHGLGAHRMPQPPPCAPQRACESGALGRPPLAEREIQHQQLAASPRQTRPAIFDAPGRGVGYAGQPGIPPAPPPPPRRLQNAPQGTWGGDVACGMEAIQPRSLSRSVREAKTCTSEAGAASIAAILQCVAHAQDLPAQQRPNSEKWTGRWVNYDAEKHVHGI